MSTNSNSSIAMLERKGAICIKEWIVRIGIVILFASFLVCILIICIKYPTRPTPNVNVSLGRLVWESITSVASGAVFLIDLVVSILLIHYAKQLRKNRIICMSVLVFVVATFDNIAIQYPFPHEWIAIVNLAAIIFCAVIVLLQKKETIYIPKYISENDTSNYDDALNNVEITRVLGNTTNKKIIAVQLYKVKTSQKFSEDGTERICFDVSHFCNDYVRAGNDINSISRISYELDRDIVDSFPIILHLYHEFRNNGDDNTKNALLNTINEKIAVLESKLQTIDSCPREVTKDDCCIARALTIFLSFKELLSPSPGAKESQDNYIGEIALHDKDLKLEPETEKKLFSLYRTGILGAALLDKDLRHVFHYRKDGTKAGRKYSVSQLVCDTGHNKYNFSAQTMYICLFTIKESSMTFIPGYMFKSISEREEEITDVLNKMRNGGEIGA